MRILGLRNLKIFKILMLVIWITLPWTVSSYANDHHYTWRFPNYVSDIFSSINIEFFYFDVTILSKVNIYITLWRIAFTWTVQQNYAWNHYCIWKVWLYYIFLLRYSQIDLVHIYFLWHIEIDYIVPSWCYYSPMERPRVSWHIFFSQKQTIPILRVT